MTDDRRERPGQPNAMTRVWVCQCLCPARHAIMATAGEADNEAAAEEAVERPLRETVAIALLSGALNPWCGLCRGPSEAWTYELGRTRFRTMDEATPALRESEDRQTLARLLAGEGGGC